MLGPVKSWMNENGKEITEFPLKPEQLVSLINLIDDGKVSFSIASTKIFPVLLANPSKEAANFAKEQNLIQESDVSAIGPIIDQVLDKFADKVVAYKKVKRVACIVCWRSDEANKRQSRSKSYQRNIIRKIKIIIDRNEKSNCNSSGIGINGFLHIKIR